RTQTFLSGQVGLGDVPRGVRLLRMRRVGRERRIPARSAGDAVESAEADHARAAEAAGDVVVHVAEEDFVDAVAVAVDAARRACTRAGVGVADLRRAVAVPRVHRGLDLVDTAAGVAALRSVAVPARGAAAVHHEPAIDGRFGDEGEVRVDLRRARLQQHAFDDGVLDAIVGGGRRARGDRIADERLEAR